MTQAAGSNGTSMSASEGPARVRSISPVDGELIDELDVTPPEAVAEVVGRAREAQRAWGVLPPEQRGAKLLTYRDALIERADELVDLIAREAGKPRVEGLLHEVMTSADVLSYAAKLAPSALATRERALHLFKQRRSTVSYVPRGVVGIIAPWNYPLFVPVRDYAFALAAGNGAVVKPSESTSLIMKKAKEIWDDAGMPPDLLGVVYGFGATGAALIEGGIDMCVLTGSVATGRKVAAACGTALIPCVMELGGKAPLIACADADVERTANAIVMGTFANSGQICVAVERVYAHEQIHDALLERVVQLTERLRPGDPVRDWCDIGALTFGKQIEVAEQLIADAVAGGARVECGGTRSSHVHQGFLPTVLSGCSHAHAVMREEIFGPVVPIMKVSSEDEAVQLANDSHLGLNAYVFTEDAARARRLAERIEAGGVVVNDVLINAGIADAPFGGMKQSGFGRVMGEEGMRAMCSTKHVCLERVRSPRRNPLGFPYSEKGYQLLRKASRAVFSSGGIVKRVAGLFG
jgi:succinate-semialdehyde dehydrogenase/glutarate-semialdehyde dehydrogenase